MVNISELPKEALDKIRGLVGLTAKQGKVVYGTDEVLAKRGELLVFIDDSLSENSRKKVVAKYEEVITSNNLQYIIGKENCKVFAVASGTLAAEIRKIIGGNIK